MAAAGSPAAASVPPAASAPPAAYASVERVVPSPGASGIESVPSADTAGVARSSPMQTLNQMLTAQALLVSLLLVPVSKDAGQAPLARLDDPAP